MNSIMTNVPAVIVLGAVAIPLIVYAILGVGEKVLQQIGGRAAGRSRPCLVASAS